jgi:hypothetical protein
MVAFRTKLWSPPFPIMVDKPTRAYIFLSCIVQTEATVFTGVGSSVDFVLCTECLRNAMEAHEMKCLQNTYL